MMDVVTLVLALTVGHVLLRLATAVAQRWALRARADLIRAAAQMPPGVNFIESADAAWQVCTTAAGRRR